MRILAIRGCNLASLAGEFEVDFRAGVLGRAGLFAITGPTGAGKSTLLDAICLALFGTTPRLASTGGAKIGRPGEDDADRISAYDVRGLLHRGTGRGRAEVEFEGQDGAVYRATWEVRRARERADGRFQPAVISLHRLDAGAETPLGGKNTETLELIREQIGLTFDQFRRSVLLAQGDFAAFLHAKAKERAELLEKVTGTGIYAVVSRLAHARHRGHAAEVEALDEQLKRLAVTTAEEREALEARRRQLDEAHAGRQGEVKAAEAAVAWFEALARLETAVEQAVSEHRAAVARRDEAAPRRERLARVSRVQRHAGALRELDRAAADLVSVKQSHQEAIVAHNEAERVRETARTALAEATSGRDTARAARDRAQPELQQASELDALLAEARPKAREAVQEAAKRSGEADRLRQARETLEQRVARARKARADLARWLEDHAETRLLAEAWPTVEAEIAEHRAACEASAALAREEDAAKRALEGAGERAEAADAALQGVIANLREAEEAVGRAEEAADPRAREQLATRRAGLDQRRDLAVRAVQLAAQARDDRRAGDEERRTIADAAERAEAARKRAGEQAGALPALEARLAEAKRARDQARAAMDLTAHRAELRDGEACPLCGATEHPWGHGLPKLGQDLDERVRELEQEVAHVGSERAKQQVAAEAAEAERKQATARHEAIAARLARHQKDWAALAILASNEVLPNEVQDDASFDVARALRDEVVRELGAVADDEAALGKLEKAAASARRRRDELLKGRDTAEAAAKKARDALQQAADAQSELRRQRTRAGERRDDAWRAIVRAWAPAEAEAEAEAFVADPAATADRWRGLVDTWRRKSRRLEEAREALEKLEPELSGTTKEAEAVAVAAAEAARRRDELQGELAGLGERRGALLGGQTVQAVRASLDAAVARAEDIVGKAQEADTAAESKLASVASAREASRKHLADATGRHEAAGQGMRAVLESEGLALDALRELLAHDAAWIEAEQDALALLERVVGQAEAVVAERGRSLAEHREGQPEGLDAESAVRRLAEAKGALAEVEGERQEVLVAVARDDEARQQGAELQALRAEKHEVAELWGSLSDAIGSHDGSKFRRFAQGLTLDALLVQANHHLEALAPRYRLERVPGEDLELQVVDRHMGDEIRSVPSLSGGETFLASLALALGLATLSSESTPVRSLFIDEGFGTLDRSTLEAAMSALDALQAQGRQVGIISHVDGLAEHVGVQIRVERLGGGRSRVVPP